MKEEPLILIVEDEVIVAMNLEDLFSQAGYRTATAATAAEVGEALLRSHPAAAVVDMRLRDGMTGPDIARHLAELGLPVVIHSGDRIAHDVPAAAHILKPASDATILAAVRDAIAGKKPR